MGRKFKCASELLVNGTPAKEYLHSELRGHERCFPYVDMHLYYVFFEVLQNALHASIQTVGPDGRPLPIHASLVTGSSLADESERTVKIADFGQGIGRDDVRKVWSYF